MELLKQGQYQPMKLSDQIALIFAGTGGHADKIPADRVKEWQESYLRYFNSQYAALAENIATNKKMTDDVRAGLTEAVTTFNQNWS
jgi:F-type H+-transporting ATPase subunit alpha